jgi:uncharacterized metal-binding protein YceD (DUF177 family)
MTEIESSWRVPVRVEDIADGGTHVNLVADEKTRAAIATTAGLRTLPRLEASFDMTRQGQRVRVVGEVSATVGQICVVTLDPIENEVRESVDLVFAPMPSGTERDTERGLSKGEEPPEHLIDGIVDLGAIAIEFLILSIDPYPRKPGAVFGAASIGEDTAHPFADLAKLKQP